MGEDDAFRHPRRPRGEEHRRGIAPAALRDLLVHQARMTRKSGAPELEQLLVAHELRLIVVAQAARIVEVDPAQAPGMRLDLEELVDLLLVAGAEGGAEDAHLVGEVPPGPCLPDTAILLPERRARATLLRMAHEQLGKRVQGPPPPRAAGFLHKKL